MSYLNINHPQKRIARYLFYEYLSKTLLRVQSPIAKAAQVHLPLPCLFRPLSFFSLTLNLFYFIEGHGIYLFTH